MHTKIVLISGQQGSGKTTLTNELRRRLLSKPPSKTRSVTELRFAEIIYRLHDMILKEMRELGVQLPFEKKDGYLLQLLGTEWGRKTVGENVWVDALKGQLEHAITWRREAGFENTLVIISDCRFENEFDGFPEALRVRLMCAEVIRESRTDCWRDTTAHPSETALDDYSKRGLFDLYIDTQITSIPGTADLVIAQLDKNVWMEKRANLESR